MRARRWSVGLLAAFAAGAVSLAACSSGEPSNPQRASGSAEAPVGFDTVGLRIRRADGSLCELCTYVARTREEHRRGLMGVTDLAGFDGMTFVFDPPSALSFWMRDTLLPLTGVWFDAEGAYLGAADMDPCPAGETACPFYGPGVRASVVVELPQGAAQRRGIGEGSVLESLTGPCRPGAAPAPGADAGPGRGSV